ncbi:MAG: acetate--CoA ligase family protein [Deltaproteobacteria bacterium]|nr:acetate--CoA ligase family protein [Deltaproteobacteria bacterium]
MSIIELAQKRGAKTLSEHDSKRFLSNYGVPVTREKVARTEDEAVRAAVEIGYPVVLKGSGEALTHKSELDLVAVDLRDESDVRLCFQRFRGRPQADVEEVLVQQMVKGERELVAGLTRDRSFGPCVMFGLGGIFTEILRDTCFRLAPLTHNEAIEMLDEIRAKKILDAVRGKPAADRDALAKILVAIGQIGIDWPQISEIDINPIKLDGGRPVAVDALVVLEPTTARL